jgi:signal transduction histidine kinase
VTFRVVCDWVSVGVDLFVAVWFAALSVRGPTSRVLAPFALLAGLVGLSHLAGLAIVAAPHVALAARAQDLFEGTLLLAVAAFVEVAASLAKDVSALSRIAWTWCGVGAVLAFAGLSHDPSFPTTELPHVARLGPTGVIATVVALVWIGWSLVTLVRATWQEPRLWRIVMAVVLPVVFALWDVAARSLDLPYGSLSGLVRSMVVVTLAWVLLARMLEVERTLAAKTEELAASTARLREAQVELDRTEQLAAVGELSAVIAHEIRNPLAVLANAAASLEKGDLPPASAAHLLAVLDEEGDRLDRLVDDVLVYARPLAPQRADVDLRGVVTHAARLALESPTRSPDLVVAWDGEGPPEWIHADATLIRHALVNILDNAILAMPRGGTVQVRMQPVEVRGAPGVAVEFRDEGEGMDTQVRARATDPFFTTRESGTGLGLAIVDRVARVHGGSVRIESRAGTGTVVTFVVPRAPRTSAVDLERGLVRETTRPLPAWTGADV